MSGSYDKTPVILAADLMQVITALIHDIHPNIEPRTLTLDSILDKQLGLDSLARMELLTRLEKQFKINLPAQLIMEANTPHALLQMLIGHGMQQTPHETSPVIQLDSSQETADHPEQVNNLVDLLDWHVQSHPDREHIRMLDENGSSETLSYQQLQQQATTVAAGLQQHGVEPGDRVAIMLPTGREYFISFYAILIAGAVPVPLYPPLRMNQIEDHLKRHCTILSNCRAVTLITFSQALLFARLLKSHVNSIHSVACVDELLSISRTLARPFIVASDIAFLQYTSGSTGNPKGVVLTHGNLLTNIRYMGQYLKVSSGDVFVSWLPLYHDMGLIGAWLGSLYFAMPLVIMSPLAFLSRPLRWFEAIHQYRGTLSAAPNFAYELCLKRIDKDDVGDIDLSCWRLAFNGAEPVSPTTLLAFAERYAESGLRLQSLTPVYGLAESSVGLAFPPLDRGPLIDRIQRTVFSETGHALPADKNDSSVLQFVACGQALPDHQIRIVDEDSEELASRHQGRVQFKGPSSTQGYFDNPQATRQLFDHEWLDSGDLGYVAEGEVYITGRSKDIIIRAGRNIYPHELEERIGAVTGIRKGCVAVFGATDSHSGTEKLVILAESCDHDSVRAKPLQVEINTITTELIGSPPDDVVIAPPHTVLKTSSGKIRRSACRTLYENGELGQTQHAVWRQFMNITLSALRPSVRRLGHQVSSIGYASYAWAIFLLLAVPTWYASVLLPKRQWRWSFIHVAARLVIKLTGNRLAIHDGASLPDSGCIIVANHASYMDGVVLAATLPGSFGFVAKAELKKQFIAGIFLRRLGSHFVERFDPRKGLGDLKALQTDISRSQTLVFFPEGTFTIIPGLRSFHMGAFITAVERNVPIVPVAISGTRSILRGREKFPHRGRIDVNVGQPIYPQAEDSSDWHRAIGLRDSARQYILQHSGEPDTDSYL
ncbi:MAG TPA: acyl-phosphate glycerol 3-phosphate acyltransferase [Gammaproteobacteria bacterium]|nr:acyl-phosphate glycerol 3-phosphate acyltransferase [Gammaproteobacteria bacterium]